MFITKKKHNTIVKELLARVDLHKQYDEMRKDNQKNNDSLIKLLDKIVDKTKNYLTVDNTSGIVYSTGGGYELSLPETVPVYVTDYFGGKVIKQEATPVTILDSNGKATYALTKEKPPKGKNYILHYDF